MHADHAVIQHVRSGVVIGTYYFPLRSTSLSYEHTCTLTAPPTERQTVRLFLTGGEEPQSVLPEINDLAVSIRYRTVNDRAVGGSTAETTYNSRNIFLSDLQTEDGNQKYTQLGAHQMVELAFDEAFVDEITGITVSSMGNLKLTLSAPCGGG